MIEKESIKIIAYKDLHSYVNTLDVENYEELDTINNIVNILKSDSRKNVVSLGFRLENRVNKYTKEIDRVKAMYEFDRSFGDYEYVAGVDEVGRGPLAGPIVAAAVILNYDAIKNDSMILGLNDSKKISPEKRESLFSIITEKAAHYKIVLLDNNAIDEKGIGVCNHEVFLQACQGLEVKPELVLSDGYHIRGYSGNNMAVIKGDSKSAAIAAASIIAKVYRDRLMKEYSKVYPQYGFDKNAGYGTQEHMAAIKKYGITPIHRKSFLRALIE
ncbi:ribonuclease HII [Clostridium thermarum]|uniref:ribonuclease HII n=1 Tax=Clostridium thermarum TaxID=1716543 RepID=UPI0013D2773C|nr:ribonuclease HII [Clostridium thermarum]